MVEIALGFLWGEAAKETDASRREWQKVFDAEQAQKDIAKYQQQTIDVSNRQLEWEKRSQKLQNDYNLGVLDRNERTQWARDTMDLMKGSAPEQQLKYYQALRDAGSMYAPTALATITTGLQTTPDKAAAFLSTVTNAEPGTAFDTDLVRINAQAMANYMGKTGKDAEAYVQGYVDQATQLKSDKGTVDQAKVENLKLQNSELSSRIDQNAAQTSLISQQEKNLAQDAGFAAETHPLEIKKLQNTNEALRLDNVQKDLVNGKLPDQLEANIADTWASVQGKADAHEVFAKTLDYTVRQAAAATGLAEEDLRFTVATASVREALAQGNLDQVRATVDYIHEQTQTEAFQRDYLSAQTSAVVLGMQATQVGIIQDLVKNGNGDLLTELAPKLLDGLVAPDRRDNLVSSLQDIAGTNLSTDQKAATANARIATENAEFAEQTHIDRVKQQAAAAKGGEAQADLLALQADTFMEGFQLDQEAKRAGMLNDNARTQSYIASVSNTALASQATPGMTPLEVLKDVKDATGWTTEKLASERDSLNQMKQELATVKALTGYDPVTGELTRDNQIQQVTDIMNKYGMNTESAKIGIAGLTAAIAAKEDNIVNGVHQILDGGLQEGVQFSASNLGLAADDPLYVGALTRFGFVQAGGENPDLKAPTEGSLDIRAEVQTAVNDFARTADSGALVFGARGVYDSLSDEYGKDALNAIGVTQPADLVPTIQRASQEFDSNSKQATDYMTARGYDITSRADRDAAQADIGATLGYIARTRENLTLVGRSPDATDADYAEVQKQVRNVLGAMSDQQLRDAGVVDMWGNFNLGKALPLLQQRESELVKAQSSIQYMNSH